MWKISILLLIFLSACMQSGEETIKEVDMLSAAGDSLGTATLREHPDGVEIELELEGLTPGFHAIHVHENAACEPPDFSSAGNHFNPDDNEHGLMHPEGAHLGDLPNIEADSSGKVEVELMVQEATLLDDKNSLLNDGGTSLVIHEAADDGYSQPAGDSGARIICGEISDEEEEE